MPKDFINISPTLKLYAFQNDTVEKLSKQGILTVTWKSAVLYDLY